MIVLLVRCCFYSVSTLRQKSSLISLYYLSDVHKVQRRDAISKSNKMFSQSINLTTFSVELLFSANSSPLILSTTSHDLFL